MIKSLILSFFTAFSKVVSRPDEEDKNEENQEAKNVKLTQWKKSARYQKILKDWSHPEHIALRKKELEIKAKYSAIKEIICPELPKDLPKECIGQAESFIRSYLREQHGDKYDRQVIYHDEQTILAMNEAKEKELAEIEIAKQALRDKGLEIMA